MLKSEQSKTRCQDWSTGKEMFWLRDLGKCEIYRESIYFIESARDVLDGVTDYAGSDPVGPCRHDIQIRVLYKLSGIKLSAKWILK